MGLRCCPFFLNLGLEEIDVLCSFAALDLASLEMLIFFFLKASLLYFSLDAWLFYYFNSLMNHCLWLR
jgi:hypothetical protein